MKKIITGILLTCSFLIAEGDEVLDVSEAIVDPLVSKDSNSWEHKLSIYGWLPTLNGKLTFDLPEGPDDPDDPDDPEGGGTATSSFLDKLDMVFMGAYEIRKEIW